MAKRLITALLGASFALVLGASAASASPDIDSAEDLANARAEAITKAIKQAHARAGIQAQAEEGNPECLGPDDPAVAQAVKDLNAAADSLLEKDKALQKLGAEFAAFNEKFDQALEESTTAAELNAAFKAYKAALLNWSARMKARFNELKPEFAALVDKHLAALTELKACEEVIQSETDLYDGGQFFVDVLSEGIDVLINGDGEEFPGLLTLARDIVDEAIKNLPPPPAQHPDSTLPGNNDGDSLPDTGASALPMLLGGLALISGGSTVVLAVRRRRAA